MFPGLAASVGLRCSFLTDPTWVTELPESELEQICGKTGAVLALADLFHQKIGALYTLTSVKPEVVLCLPPESVRKRVKPRLGDGEEPSEEDENSEPDFHDYLKGLCLHCSP